MKTILITGGTGLIGSALSEVLLRKGYAVRHLSRSPKHNDRIKSYKWDLDTNYIDSAAFVGIDILIHLAGAPVSPKRWTTARIKLLDESRSKSAELLHAELAKSQSSISTYISASGSHYYGAVTTNKTFLESDSAGSDIMGGITTRWEKAADLFAEKARVVKLRTPVVLSAKGGALPMMAMPAKLSLASALGSGKQWMPWVHLNDLVNAYVLAIENNTLNGAYNVCAPEQITNKAFMSALSRALKRPFWVPRIPAWALRAVLGKQSVILLEGSRLSNAKIIAAGLSFSYPNLDSALVKELG